ncbi:MAG: glycosyltransferase [Victivallales bacterium]
MQKKKIKIICLIGQIGNGGSERQLYLFLKYLDRKRYSPLVIVSSKSGGSRWERQIREELDVRIRFLGDLPKAAKFAKFAWAVFKNRTNVVFSWSFYTNALCMSCPGTRFIGSLRGDLLIEKEQISSSNFRYSLKPRHFVVNTKILADELKLEGVPEENISVIYNIFKAEEDCCEVRRTENCRRIRDEYKIPQESVVVAGIGRSLPEKDFSFFISVFHEAALLDSRIFGLLIGDIGEEIKREIRDKNLENRFVLTGEVESAQKLLPAADIFFLSSRNEGLPNALIEAIDSGCAPLATDVGGVREVLEPYGQEIIERTLISGREVPDAAGKLLFLAGNPGFRKEISSRRLKTLEKFSPDTVMSGYYQILEKSE